MSEIKQDIINEIHRNARKNFPRRKVILKDIDDLWQADLVDMQKFSKYNHNYKYILVTIDTFSKYAWAFPLKQKNKESVCDAFQNLFTTEGRQPKNLQTDFGTEFYNSRFKKLTRKYSINHYSTYSNKKASIVERFIRTLKSNLYKVFHLQGNYKWITGALSDVIHKYNNTKHRTIGISPASVNTTNKRIVLKRIIDKINFTSQKSNIKVDDFVRISKYKSCFDKGYTPNWSTEIFKVVAVQNTNPVTYLLQDMNKQPILGTFYAEELQRTKHPNYYLVEKVLKRKGNKVYVKWLGLSSKENSWIDNTNVA